MNTGQKNSKGRTIFRGPRGGEYVLGPGGKKIRTFTRATAAAPAGSSPIPVGMKKKLRVGNKFVSRNGYVYNRNGTLLFPRYINSHAKNTVLRNAYNKDPKYLRKYEIPFINNNTRPVPARLKLMANGTMITGRYNDRMRAKVFFDKFGILYFVTLNGRKIPVTEFTHSHSRLASFRQSLLNVRKLKRMIGAVNARFPRSAIPPASPPPVRPARSLPALLENMMNQIYLGGRGSNVNATRYTPEERERLAVRLSESIQAFKQLRNQKRSNARVSWARANEPGIASAIRASHLNAASRALERVGYYDDAIRAYTRGLRAVKPLTGNVPASVRRMAATPNRWTPAPAGENYNTLYNEMTKPHLVVKVPGITAPIYLTPNSFRGLVKNAARVNIAPNNLRDWLRMARRNFPNEPLFRHPINKSKNVLPTHVRFSRS